MAPAPTAASTRPNRPRTAWIDSARTVERLRRIDAWGGAPLCFVATRLQRLIGRWRRVPERVAPRRLLCIKLSENGSVVLLSPMFRRLAARWPDAEVVFLTFEENREVLRIVGGIEGRQLVTIDPTSPITLLASTLRAIVTVRAMRVDATVDLEFFSRFTALLGFVIGAPKRVGFHRYELEGLYRGDLLTHRVPYNPYHHTARAFVGLVDALDQDAAELPLGKHVVPADPGEIARFEPAPGARGALEAKLAAAAGAPIAGRRVFVLNPNASERIPIRKWPLERYVEVARRLLEAPDHLVVLIGTGDDARDAATIASRVGSHRCLDMTNRTSFEELLTLFTLAEALVTNDSGPAHFASLTATPAVVLFGPESPALYGPLGDRNRTLYADLACSPCVSAFNHRRTPCSRARCLEAIEVDHVMAALDDLGAVRAPLRVVV